MNAFGLGERSDILNAKSEGSLGGVEEVVGSVGNASSWPRREAWPGTHCVQNAASLGGAIVLFFAIRDSQKLKALVTDKCPFVDLPETGRARWGENLDAEKMKKWNLSGT